MCVREREGEGKGEGEGEREAERVGGRGEREQKRGSMAGCWQAHRAAAKVHQDTNCQKKFVTGHESGQISSHVQYGVWIGSV